VLSGPAAAHVEPLIIVGVVVCYVVTLLLAPSAARAEAPATDAPDPAAAGAVTAGAAT
jgi:hypothetical protein